MKQKFLFRAVIILISLTFNGANAQSGENNKIAVLPFEFVGIEQISAQSSELLLRHQLEKLHVGRLIPQVEIKRILNGGTCSEITCAMEIGVQLEADRVVTCKLIALGEKVIAQYMLFDIPEQKVLLLDQITALYLEDLDVVMKRMATSILHGKPADKIAEVGLITENEANTPRRRATRKYTGFSFGYLYPHKGYDDTDRSFTLDFRTGAEIKNYFLGMQLAIRKGFAMNIFASYLATKTDFCPYAGGAFGFHWVSHEEEYRYEQGFSGNRAKKSDGFELTANAGVIAFRTYNIQLIANLAYLYTFNDYDDQALVFTIGLLR